MIYYFKYFLWRKCWWLPGNYASQFTREDNWKAWKLRWKALNKWCVAWWFFGLEVNIPPIEQPPSSWTQQRSKKKGGAVSSNLEMSYHSAEMSPLCGLVMFCFKDFGECLTQKKCGSDPQFNLLKILSNRWFNYQLINSYQPQLRLRDSLWMSEKPLDGLRA